jgi:hypothetical protein
MKQSLKIWSNLLKFAEIWWCAIFKNQHYSHKIRYFQIKIGIVYPKIGKKSDSTMSNFFHPVDFLNTGMKQGTETIFEARNRNHFCNLLSPCMHFVLKPNLESGVHFWSIQSDSNFRLQEISELNPVYITLLQVWYLNFSSCYLLRIQHALIRIPANFIEKEIERIKPQLVWLNFFSRNH